MIRKNIPNFLTLCNLLCGCIAIVFAFSGHLVWSAYMVGIACVFDFLDGMVARLLNVHSEIGKQLDSLADMVSFGVVPGVMMFILFQYAISINWGFTGEYAHDLLPCFSGFLITIFSAIRLAKFNLDTRQTDSFIGLPTPANTILISSFALIVDFSNLHIADREELRQNILLTIILDPYFLIALSLIASFLLVAPVRLFALKFKNFSWADNKVRYIFLVLALALLILLQFAGIPLIIILYIVISIINNIATRTTSQP